MDREPQKLGDTLAGRFFDRSSNPPKGTTGRGETAKAGPETAGVSDTDIRQKRERNVPWFQVPNAIYDMSLDLYQKAVLCYLCRCNNQGGEAFPAYKTIAEKTGMSRRRAVDAVRQLGALDLIRITRRKQRGRFTSNLYEVVWHRFQQETSIRSGAPGALGIAQNMHRHSAPDALNKEPLYREPSYGEPLGEGPLSRTLPLSFQTFIQRYKIREDALEGMRYFVRAYRKHRGREHPALKPETWKQVAQSLFTVHDEAYNMSHEMDEDDLERMINHYFTKTYQDGCNYSIVHFNNDGIKKVNFYEAAY